MHQFQVYCEDGLFKLCKCTEDFQLGADVNELGLHRPSSGLAHVLAVQRETVLMILPARNRNLDIFIK